MYNGFKFPLEINDFNRTYFEEVKAEAQKLYNEPVRNLTYSTFKLYKQSGGREEYEQEYMLHRKMLCAFSAMVYAEQGEEWMDKLCDAIWAVCDEYTWVVPAHILKWQDTPEKVTVGRIDLFAAETAVALCEIYHILEDKLPQQVRARIEYEVMRRIVLPYVEARPKFGVSNWSGVCGCGVTASLVYLGRHEEFDAVKDNLIGNLRDFLDSFNDDGCCLEGSLYWFYGFSHFVFAANLLREYTKGEIDFFKEEKVKNISLFVNDLYLEDNYCLSFSDSPHTCDFDMGILCFLAKEYDGITLPDLKYASKFQNSARYRYASFVRNLYWACAVPKKEKKKGCVYYKDAQWYINRKDRFTFAAKSGHNLEPHNHNDVGSFIVFAKGKYIIDDIGWERYVADYFGPNRYTHICPASRSHSVPVVEGKEQVEGLSKRGDVTAVDENTFAFDFEKAYDIPSLTKLSRRFEIREKEIVIKEHAEGNIENIVYRFVTRIKPVVKDGKVFVDEFCISCKNKAEISVSSFDFEPRFAGFGGEEKMYKAYTVDFKPETIHETEFVISCQ